ncbi:MAG TPA: DUF3800 domain-containing protein [Candidatus Hydrogenedentes bacterium]|nr:DUF3800 domain-containing protein [Candidatus Hydrogenedentota bacterium]HIJ74994.1 DUF3800 domain-containing protein [Candidatus Hydrogenedentota bacterium]
MTHTPPGKLRWLISCDESGVHNAPYYGFGTLWMKYQRRGDFAKDLRELKADFRYEGEVKWSKANNRRYTDFFIALIDYFFLKRWMAFHCFVVRRAIVKKELHSGSWDLARRKHFTQLLTNKMKTVSTKHRDRDVEFRIYVDPIASSYDKADEAVEIISMNTLRQKLGSAPTLSVITRDSKDTPTIQLCDLLLGAVMEAWQQKASSEGKLLVQQAVSEGLGWPDLRADTVPFERKFNIWYFYDEEQGAREVTTRDVKLKHPYP